MFEKEAEEYRKDLKSKFFLSEPQLDLACQGFKDGYKKANEWHKVADGDLPTTVGRRFLVSNRYCTMIGYWNGKTFVSADEDIAEIANPIAWCEIPTFDKE